jgi:hypothetical protein
MFYFFFRVARGALLALARSISSDPVCVCWFGCVCCLLEDLGFPIASGVAGSVSGRRSEVVMINTGREYGSNPSARRLFPKPALRNFARSARLLE